jgi:hypothetical protein
LAEPRKPARRREIEPDEDNVKVAPLNTRVAGPLSVAGDAMAWGPDPLSAVNEMPVSVPEESDASRLVMSTFKNMKRFALKAAFGVPPEQLKTMSPTLSVIPSPWTIWGEADGLQFKVAACPMEQMPAKTKNKKAKNWRNMKDYLGCSLSKDPSVVYALLQ